MRDTYSNYSDLSAHEREGRDYRRRWKCRDSNMAVIAPHGGGIEPGTSEIAEAIAGEEFSLYRFEGIKRKHNYKTLHITSTHFDEPKCVKLVRRTSVVIAIHVLKGKKEEIYVGGLDGKLGTRIRKSFERAGFIAKKDSSHHSGACPRNICNRGSTRKGIQLEITRGLRNRMFHGLSRRKRQIKEPTFYKFVKAVRDVLPESYKESD